MSKIFGFVIALLVPLPLAGVNEQGNVPQYRSSFMRVELAADQPAFAALTVDSLGKNIVNLNPLRPVGAIDRKFTMRQAGSKFEYRAEGAPPSAPPSWTFEFSAKQIRLRSSYSSRNPPPQVVLNFNTLINHATLLGMMNDDGSVRLPAILHLPDQGTFRITSSAGNRLALGYDAQHYQEPKQTDDYVKVTFPAASAATGRSTFSPTRSCP